MIKKILLTCGLFAWAVGGLANDTALDYEGNLYKVFAVTSEESASLQLDIYAKDGTKNSLLVWEANNRTQISKPEVVFSANARRLYIVFSTGNGVFSDIVLASYSARGGLSIINLTAGEINRSGINPVLVQTSFVRNIADQQRILSQMLHIIWWENGVDPGAHYASLVVLPDEQGIDDLIRISLNDELSPGSAAGDLSLLTPPSYQNPLLFAPSAGSHAVRAFFFNSAILQYQVVDLTYPVEPEVSEDRAHFPDIGIMVALPINPDFMPSQSVTTVLNSTGNVAMFSIEPDGIAYTYYCQGWTKPSKLPSFLPKAEVEKILSTAIDLPH